MKKSEFISVSKRMVKEYFNRYVALPNKFEKILARDVMILAFEEKPNNYKILLTVLNTDGTVYGVTYDKTIDAIHSYIYNTNGLFRKINTSEKEVSKRR